MRKIKFETKIKSNDKKLKVFKVLIVDDDLNIHKMTKFILNDFDFKYYKLEFISAYSGEETKKIIKNTSDIAVILLDVVMETSDAGLEVVKYIREELNNHLVRIIIRTGQPGYAPEREVIIKYEINNYLEKTDSSSTRLFSAMVTALRSYQDLTSLQKQDDIIRHQSKMSAMGEMIEYISHQWKQPLSTVSAIISNISIKNMKGELTADKISSSMRKIEDVVMYQSQTIDDFKDFFITSKRKNHFLLNKTFEKILNLLENQFKYQNIKIINNVHEVSLFGLENELVQVILNILNNAKDELIKNVGVKRCIFLDVKKAYNEVLILIKDTAGGIPSELTDKIFESRFTTKDKEKGSGLGLYMSKVIIEEHMNGILSVSNTEFVFEGHNYIGAEFKITLEGDLNS